MNETFTKIKAWIETNKLLAVVILLGVVFMFFGRQVKKLLFGKRRIRHRPGYYKLRTVTRRRIRRTNRKPLPRSVSMHKASGRGYPKAGGGYIPFKRNKDGSVKKAWQVAGTVAAKSRMSKLRRAR